jgi:hypothetical protein
MLRHLHSHRLYVRGAAEQKKALPEPDDAKGGAKKKKKPG